MQPTPTLSKQRVVFLRFLIDLQQANAIPGDIDDYYGHESRATRAVGDSRRFMTVVFHRKSKPQHIEAWLKRKDKLLNATDEEYTFLGFTENNIKNGHLLYFREGPDWTVETLKQHFGEGLWDVYRRGGYGKYSARLGLSFSSTVTSVEVLPAEVHTLDDLQADDSSLTSDGSGLIRDSFARELIALHNLPPDTSVFQIRHAGYKGTTTRVPDAYFDQQCGARGKKVAYRPSMLKYTGGPNMFEIQSISRPPRVARVNMQFIILLLTRGVPMRVLEEMLQMQIDEIGEIATNRERALHYIDGELDSEGSGIGFFQELYEMLLAGHDLDEPYLAVLLHRFQKSTYDGLRSKLNFIAPRSYYLLGVVDPYGVLQDGQVYMNLPMHGGPQVGALAFMRNPAYDADGLVVLEGVNVPQLSHIVNTVVFAAGGATSQTARMSGGDLDGDLYFCTANPLLIPAHRPPLPVNAPPAHTPRQRRGAIGTRQPQAEPTTSDSRNTAEDMFRDAVKTFLDHRHNFLLGMMSNDFMKRVVNTAELADSAECRALLPLILATLDALKNDGKISLLRLAFDDFKTNHPERIINGHRNPLHQLQDMVPNLGERRMDDFKVDMDLILEDSQGVGELWAEKLQEAVPIMNEYGGRLQMAIAADADAKALKLEDGGEKRTDRVKREFFEREFPALTRQNILVELPNRILKASVFYATGYGNGKQSFAWVGARYLNYLKAISCGRPPLPIGPQSRPLRPVAPAPAAPGPPPPPSSSSSSSSRTATVVTSPASTAISISGSGSAQRPHRTSTMSDDHFDGGSTASPTRRSSSGEASSDDNTDIVDIPSWSRATLRATRPAATTPTPSEFRASASPSIRAASTVSSSSPASTISSSASSRIRRIPLPESVPSTPGFFSEDMRSISRHSRHPSTTSRGTVPSSPAMSSTASSSITASSSASSRIRRIPLPESAPATPSITDEDLRPIYRHNDSNSPPQSPIPTPRTPHTSRQLRPAPPPIRRSASEDTDIEDYDVVRPESADEAEAAHAYHSPPRRVIREQTDRTLVDGVHPGGSKVEELLSPMSLTLENLSASPNVTHRSRKGKETVMSPTRPRTPYDGYRPLLLSTPPRAATQPLARSHSENMEGEAVTMTYPPRALGRTATFPLMAASTSVSANLPRSTTTSSSASANLSRSTTSSPSKHHHTFNIPSNGGPLVCRCGELFKR